MENSRLTEKTYKCEKYCKEMNIINYMVNYACLQCSKKEYKKLLKP